MIKNLKIYLQQNLIFIEFLKIHKSAFLFLFYNVYKKKMFTIEIEDGLDQGCKARKVISEVYTSLVLQCTVSGR